MKAGISSILPALALAMCVIVQSCESIRAPRSKVPSRTRFEYDAFGGYAHITCNDSAKYEGELIGSRNDSIVIMNAKAKGIARTDIVRAFVIVYNPNEYGWGYLSLVATISNGYFLVFTGPLWLIATSAAVSNEGVPNYKKYPATVRKSATKQTPLSKEEAWKEILKYSRFPQGVPQEVRLGDLKER